jgi:hypothetical protein
MPKSLGMLEPGHRDDDDRRRSLHARLRILRGDNGETIRAGRRRTKARRGSSAPDEFETRRDHRGRARRSERRRRGIISRARSLRFARWILQSSSKCLFRIFTPMIGAFRSCSTPPRHLQSQHGNGRTADAVVRSRAKYRTSLQGLRRQRNCRQKIVTKSGVMLGLGEKEPELFQTMDDLREVGCQC